MQDAVAANQLDRPQQITEWMRDLDGFNWGYDPLHFGAPEGSYATQRERRGPHPRVPPHGQGPERDRPAHGDGRGLQPHQRLRPESARDARPPRAGLLPPARRQHRQRLQGLLLRRHGGRVRDDGKADDRHRRHLGARLQGVGLPLRHHDVPPAGVDAEVPGRGRRPWIPPCTSTARAGTSAPSRTTSASRRPARPTSAARASAASATASATRCAAAGRSTAARTTC